MGDAIPLLQYFKMPRPVGGVIHVCPVWAAAWGCKSPAGPDGGNC